MVGSCGPRRGPLPKNIVGAAPKLSNMKFVSVIHNLDRAAGGPVSCVLQLRQNLRTLGHQMEILTPTGATEASPGSSITPEKLLSFSKKLRNAMDGEFDVML